MQAFQFVAAQKPAELREVQVPEPGPGQVLLKVGGAGACHSDLHILEAAPKPGPARAPFTLGHENAGWVEKLGWCDGVRQGRSGDRLRPVGLRAVHELPSGAGELLPEPRGH